MVEGAAARERRDRAAFTSIVAGGIGTWQEVRAGRGKVYLPSHDCLACLQATCRLIRDEDAESRPVTVALSEHGIVSSDLVPALVAAACGSAPGQPPPREASAAVRAAALALAPSPEGTPLRDAPGLAAAQDRVRRAFAGSRDALFASLTLLEPALAAGRRADDKAARDARLAIAFLDLLLSSPPPPADGDVGGARAGEWRALRAQLTERAADQAVGAALACVAARSDARPFRNECLGTLKALGGLWSWIDPTVFGRGEFGPGAGLEGPRGAKGLERPRGLGGPVGSSGLERARGRGDLQSAGAALGGAHGRSAAPPAPRSRSSAGPSRRPSSSRPAAAAPSPALRHLPLPRGGPPRHAHAGGVFVRRHADHARAIVVRNDPKRKELQGGDVAAADGPGGAAPGAGSAPSAALLPVLHTGGGVSGRAAAAACREPVPGATRLSVCEVRAARKARALFLDLARSGALARLLAACLDKLRPGPLLAEATPADFAAAMEHVAWIAEAVRAIPREDVQGGSEETDAGKRRGEEQQSELERRKQPEHGGEPEPEQPETAPGDATPSPPSPPLLPFAPPLPSAPSPPVSRFAGAHPLFCLSTFAFARSLLLDADASAFAPGDEPLGGSRAVRAAGGAGRARAPSAARVRRAAVRLIREILFAVRDEIEGDEGAGGGDGEREEGAGARRGDGEREEGAEAESGDGSGGGAPGEAVRGGGAPGAAGGVPVSASAPRPSPRSRLLSPTPADRRAALRLSRKIYEDDDPKTGVLSVFARALRNFSNRSHPRSHAEDLAECLECILAGTERELERIARERAEEAWEKQRGALRSGDGEWGAQAEGDEGPVCGPETGGKDGEEREGEKGQEGEEGEKGEIGKEGEGERGEIGKEGEGERGEIGKEGEGERGEIGKEGEGERGEIGKEGEGERGEIGKEGEGERGEIGKEGEGERGEIGKEGEGERGEVGKEGEGERGEIGKEGEGEKGEGDEAADEKARGEGVGDAPDGPPDAESVPPPGAPPASVAAASPAAPPASVAAASPAASPAAPPASVAAASPAAPPASSARPSSPDASAPASLVCAMMSTTFPHRVRHELATPASLHALLWLLSLHRLARPSASRAVGRLLARVALPAPRGLGLPAMFFQLSTLRTFYDLLADRAASRDPSREEARRVAGRVVRDLLARLREGEAQQNGERGGRNGDGGGENQAGAAERKPAEARTAERGAAEAEADSAAPLLAAPGPATSGKEGAAPFGSPPPELTAMLFVELLFWKSAAVAESIQDQYKWREMVAGTGRPGDWGALEGAKRGRGRRGNGKGRGRGGEDAGREDGSDASAPPSDDDGLSALPASGGVSRTFARRRPAAEGDAAAAGPGPGPDGAVGSPPPSKPRRRPASGPGPKWTPASLATLKRRFETCNGYKDCLYRLESAFAGEFSRRELSRALRHLGLAPGKMTYAQEEAVQRHCDELGPDPAVLAERMADAGFGEGQLRRWLKERGLAPAGGRRKKGGERDKRTSKATKKGTSGESDDDDDDEELASAAEDGDEEEAIDQADESDVEGSNAQGSDARGSDAGDDEREAREARPAATLIADLAAPQATADSPESSHPRASPGASADSLGLPGLGPPLAATPSAKRREPPSAREEAEEAQRRREAALARLRAMRQVPEGGADADGVPAPVAAASPPPRVGSPLRRERSGRKVRRLAKRGNAAGTGLAGLEDLEDDDV